MAQLKSWLKITWSLHLKALSSPVRLTQSTSDVLTQNWGQQMPLHQGTWNKQGRVGECKNNHLSDFFQAAHFYSPKPLSKYGLINSNTMQRLLPIGVFIAQWYSHLPKVRQLSFWKLKCSPDFHWLNALPWLGSDQETKLGAASPWLMPGELCSISRPNKLSQLLKATAIVFLSSLNNLTHTRGCYCTGEHVGSANVKNALQQTNLLWKFPTHHALKKKNQHTDRLFQQAIPRNSLNCHGIYAPLPNTTQVSSIQAA